LADGADHLGAGGVPPAGVGRRAVGLAAATTYFPALLFPLWLSFYWKRGAAVLPPPSWSPPRWPSPLSH